MDNAAQSIGLTAIAKTKLDGEDIDMDTYDPADLVDSGEEVSMEESSEEDIPELPIAKLRQIQYARLMSQRGKGRPSMPKRLTMSQKRKMEAVKTFHDFTKKLKKDMGITIRSLKGGDLVELDDYLTSDSDNQSESSDGLSEEHFEVNPNAVLELNEADESYIDPVTGDFIEPPKTVKSEIKNDEDLIDESGVDDTASPKTLTIGDIINDNDIDLSKNVEITDIIEGSEVSLGKSSDSLNVDNQDSSRNRADFDIREKLKEMGEIDFKPVSKDDNARLDADKKVEVNEADDEKKNNVSSAALNVRRNIREVMDEKQLDASTLTAQRQELERLARVQEQQRIIREVQRQIAINRQNKLQARNLQLLQGTGGVSLLRKGGSTPKLNLPNTVLVKLPSGEVKKTTLKPGQVEMMKLQKAGATLTPLSKLPPHIRIKKEDVKKEVVEIVDSTSSSEQSEESTQSSDSDDCIMLSDSEVAPSPEPDDDPQNSGLHVNDSYNIPDDQGRVVINIGHPENETDIFLAPQIARIIKPHQIGGVRFLFDNIIESVERFSTSTGFGCILAHSMGLGKTLQIVCFCDIFLRHTNSKSVLCIMPINTLQNWVAEFNKWLPSEGCVSPLSATGEMRARNFPIYVLNDSHKTLAARAKVVQDWNKSGGVLMIGYELYRLLSMKKDKKPRRKKKSDQMKDAKDSPKDSKDKLLSSVEDGQISSEMPNKLLEKDDSKTEDLDMSKDEKLQEDKREDEPTDEEKKHLDDMYEALVKPGPDLVICDEGHRIKNSHSNISYALKQMRTKRRIVLTGYPLQNNLLEYWCMVDFVRPNYLGTRTEFSNMFERPIQNGQCIDSTPQDIRLMRYRAHVLHSLLLGFVQRRSHAVLQSTLPQKEEYVLLVRMTPLQRQLYDTFMNDVVRKRAVPNPLKAFAICCKIWNHPDVLYFFLKKRSETAAIMDLDLDLEEAGAAAVPGTITRPTSSGGRKRPTGGKKGRPVGSKNKEKTPNKGKNAKPAATIPPNTSNLNTPGTYDTIKTEAPQYDQTQYPGNYNAYPPPPPPHPVPYSADHARPPYTPTDGNQPYNAYPPYQGYHQGYQSQNNYYGPNETFNQGYNTNYYPQPYNPEYNQYPQHGPPAHPTPPAQTNPEFSQNENYPQQGYWGPDNNYYPNPSANTYYNNQNQTAYPNNQEPYANTAYNEYPNHNNGQQYPNYDPNRGPYNQAYNTSRPEANATEEAVQPPPATYSQPAVPSAAPAADPYPGVENQQSSVYPQPNENADYQYPNFDNIAPDVKPFFGESSTQPWSDNISGKVEDKPDSSEIKAVNRALDDLKVDSKTDSDNEVKIEDLDTKKIIHEEHKRDLNHVIHSMDTSIDKKVDKTEQNDSKVSTEAVDNKEDDKQSIEDNKKENSFYKADNESPKEDTSEKEDTVQNKSKPLKDPVKKPRPRPKSKQIKEKTKPSKEKNDKKKASNEGSDSEKDSDKEKRDKEEEALQAKKSEEMTYDWAMELLQNYVPGIIENSGKMEIFFCILQESLKLGDRILLFSQSLFTLNLIEDFLTRNYIPGTDCLWAKNKSYYRLDGSTSALEREKLINEFNSNPNVHLFLVSTRAGSLGINLVGANRVIVFDASWNPCHDTQAVCRVYRYGQKKPCFVYRLVTDYCLEKKIYDRQINKQGMSDRIVDECNPDAVLSMKEITNLCWDNDEQENEEKDLNEYKDKYLDVIMQKIISEHGKTLSKEPFQHESLLVDRKEKKLSSAEKRLAQRGYELEKKAAVKPPRGEGRPVGTVRPMQRGGNAANPRWIPADVWRRQGMTAQEMTLPLDVVIPTNSAEKSNIVLKAGQRVMVLKSPKGIYMQLETGKIIAIKTSFKVGQKGNDGGKEVISKKVPVKPANLPTALKNNSAITVFSKSARGGLHRVFSRPPIMKNSIRPTTSQKFPGFNQTRPMSIIRGRGGIQIRRQVPIVNKDNSLLSNMANQFKVKREVLSDNEDTKDSDFNSEQANTNSNMSVESNCNDTTKAGPKDEFNTAESNLAEADSNDEFDSSESPANKVLKPLKNLQDEAISEDSSQEKTYVDLSNNSECKVTGKPSIVNKESLKTSDEILKQTIGNFSGITVKKVVPAHATSGHSPVSLLANEKFPSEAALSHSKQKVIGDDKFDDSMDMEEESNERPAVRPASVEIRSRTSLLKNYRHQRPGLKMGSASTMHMSSILPASSPESTTSQSSLSSNIGGNTTKVSSFESSLSCLEKTTSSISATPRSGISDFRQSLNDITRSYSPPSAESGSADHPVISQKPCPKSRKKKQPPKVDNFSDDSSSQNGQMLITDKVSKQAQNATDKQQFSGQAIAPMTSPLTTAGYNQPYSTGHAPPTGAFADNTYHPAMPNPSIVNPTIQPPNAQPFSPYPGYPPPVGAPYAQYPPSGYYPPPPVGYPGYVPSGVPGYPQYPPYAGYPPNPDQSYPGYPPGQW